MKTCGVFILVVLAIIAGLAFGLLVGWVAWPVQWINASPENMRREFQVDYLNMAIDSYSVNQDAQLAAQRFSFLGKDGPADLAYILNNPKSVSETDAQAYADAVKQTLGPGALTASTAAAAAPSLGSLLLKQPLFGYVVVALFLALLAIVLLVVLVVRLTRHTEEPVPVAEPVVTEAVAGPVEETAVTEPEESNVTAGEVAAVAAGAAVLSETGEKVEPIDVAAEAEVVPETSEKVEPTAIEEAALTEPAVQEQDTPGQVAEEGSEEGVGTAAKVAGVSAAAKAVSSLTEPGEAKEVEPVYEEQATETSAEPSGNGHGSIAKVATVGTAVAGIVSSLKGSEEEKPAATEPVTEAVVEPVAAETAPLDQATSEAGEPSDEGLGTVAKMAAAGAAVAGVASMLSGSDENEEAAPVSASAETAEDAGVIESTEEPVITPEGVLEDTKPVTTAATAGAAIAGVEWALENKPDVEQPGEPVPQLFPSTTQPATEEWIPESTTSDLDSDFYGKYNRKIIDIEGIGEVYANRLSEVGITTTHALLQQCSTRKGRDELAEKTGISGKWILEWANHADMMRVQGIGPQWSDLLEMAGVNTVRELAMRNPQNLYQKLLEVNEQKKLVRQVPSLAQLEDWIEQSKDLPKILTY